VIARVSNRAVACVVRPIVQIIGFIRLVQTRRQAVYEVRAARGIELLKEWLSPQQKAQFDALNFFEVVGCDSGKLYRIYHGMSANVFELNCGGRPRIGWCFVPAGNLVPGDVMLAQKIALETDERRALAVARQFLAPPRPVTARTAVLDS
jgi:hypothetical protein